MKDDGPKGIYELRPIVDAPKSWAHTAAVAGTATVRDAVESVVIQGEGETLALRAMHPDVLMAKARARSVHGLLWIIGVTVALGFIGIGVLSFVGHATDALREVLQTALAAEVTVLASSLGRSGA